MFYTSTRGAAPRLGFDDVLLAGLATDGGLYVPETWPTLPAAAVKPQSYVGTAEAVLSPFFAGSALQGELGGLLEQAYRRFDHKAVVPMTQLDGETWLMELFHGPTLAFKDVALQLLGLLFDRALATAGRRMTVLGATSGDTGSAAIEACRGREAIDVVILYPYGRTSEVQRRQMTTVDAANVHAIAIDGTFDDCQDLVKAAFADTQFRQSQGLGAVNSINWARIAAQSAYYVAACAALGNRPTAFSVPTGNFGNVYAAWVARSMGAPIERLVIGTNSNDILTRFFATGTMSTAGVVPTLSPSMDIQVSSNFERLLFELHARDAAKTAQTMQAFRTGGSYAVAPALLDQARALFHASAVDDDATLAQIRQVYEGTGMLIDPHTAVGLKAGRDAQAAGSIPDGMPLVALACAHPAKFPDAVERATGVRPGLPPHLADLLQRPERQARLPADFATLKRHIETHVSAGTGVAA